MKTFPLIFFVTAVSAFPNRQDTGIKQHIGGRIIGGNPAAVGQFPFVAAIYTTRPDGTYFCGGTLLTNQWVVTAAQCVENVILFDILLGSNSLDYSQDPYAVRASADVYVIHLEYDSVSLDNDIGLIWLRLPIQFSDYLQQVEFLAFDDVQQYSLGVAVGWGQISDDESGLVNDLRYVYVTALSNEECTLIYGDYITDNMVCVDGNYNQGTCLGDSGGPLIQTVSRGYPVIAGIASFVSRNGCESIQPSGFTRFYPYLEWVTNVTGRAG